MDVYIWFVITVPLLLWAFLSIYGMRIKGWSATVSTGGGFIASVLIMVIMIIPIDRQSQQDVITDSDKQGVIHEKRLGNDELFRTDYSVLTELQSMHYANVRRFVKRISVEKGRTDEAIVATLESALKDIPQSSWAHAVAVHLYEEPVDLTSVGSSYATIDYAPHGEWGKAEEKCCQEIRISINGRIIGR